MIQDPWIWLTANAINTGEGGTSSLLIKWKVVFWGLRKHEKTAVLQISVDASHKSARYMLRDINRLLHSLR